MSHRVFPCSILVTACVLALSASASAQPMGDMCSAPKMKTEKWQPITGAGGMSLMIPPGYVARGSSGSADSLDSHFDPRGESRMSGSGSGPGPSADSQDSHFYFKGEHSMIGVGSGPGPSALTDRNAVMTQTSDCEAVIAGRRLSISVYTWNRQDESMSPSGAAGQQYMVVARFYGTGAHREVYVSFRTNIQSDVSSSRQLFWTISFDAPAGEPVASAPLGAQPVGAAAPAAQCVAAPAPNLPAPDAVLDSALVQMLVAGTTPPVPHGFEVMSLRFDASGALAGITVAQSDLPDATQRQLSTLVASNLKPHDAHAPNTFLLRVESQEPGLHYTVLSATGCAP